MTVIEKAAAVSRRASLEMRAVRALHHAGMLRVESPRRFLEATRALQQLGSFGAAPRIAALNHAPFPAIADDRGELTFAELDRQVDQLANALIARGIGPGTRIGILCRNSRAPLIAAFAGSRIGADVIWLNTGFAARQASEVSDREGVELLIHDDEFERTVADIGPKHGKVVCASTDLTGGEFDDLIASASPTPPTPPPRPGRLVILTSGTTGTPKGAPRPDPRGFVPGGALLEQMPMRARETTVVPPPLFHGTGLLLALMTLSLGSKLVLRRRFEPQQFVEDVARHQATAVCVVPIMLQRVLALENVEELPEQLQSVRIVFSAGSQLPAEVAVRVTELLGDVIYNLYASTEVAFATMATPADVRIAPASVGKPMLGSRVKILDEHGTELPPGRSGRIFVGNGNPFEGYTGGGGKEIIDGLLCSGDVGHFDDDGRLYIDGRDDEMIVSGGENVFPREVEELLVAHPAIIDAAAIGVADEEFGQRLRAFIVLAAGERLTDDEVRTFIKDNLARYKVPREIVFLDELPRNPTGKVLKRELAQLEPSPGFA
jgi:fatty-acyl-CoA synthase